MFRKKTQATNKPGIKKIQAPATVFSYYSSRSPGSSERHSQPRSAKETRTDSNLLIRMPSILALAVIAGCILYATSLNTTPKVQINSPNTKQLLRENSFYQDAAAKIMGRSIFNRSKFTIDTTNIANQIEAKYPELGKVSVIVPLVSRRPIIEVQPAQAMIKLTGEDGSFIVDDQGRVLVRAQDATSKLRDSLPNVIDESGLELAIGKQVLPIASIDFISQVSLQLTDKRVTIQNMTLPTVSNELHLKVEGQPYFIKFDLQGDPRQQAGAFLAAREKLDMDKIIPAEYVDVRVPEKVFYK